MNENIQKSNEGDKGHGLIGLECFIKASTIPIVASELWDLFNMGMCGLGGLPCLFPMMWFACSLIFCCAMGKRIRRAGRLGFLIGFPLWIIGFSFRSMDSIR